ncbi:MAG: hypothetical protein AMJ95_10795 [Omnitrophica WOR_2 bacterium SM23_72]|nr:MAG: hypothetical protein AMJ95_10795 [Omnitrophica WOR_2 bacterium SM23_72]
MLIKPLKRGQLFKKKGYLFLWFLFFSSLLLARQGHAANLDDIYGALLKKGDILYDTGFDYFRMEEKGRHAVHLYGDFVSRPCFWLIDNFLDFALVDDFEFSLGSREAIPATYGRSTYDPAGDLDTIQEYDINYYRDYILGVRLRREPLEYSLDILEETQKDDWRASSYPGPANYFSYIRAHYEDFSVGARYLSGKGQEEEKSGLSLLTRPLLALHQLLVEANLRYRKSNLRMNAYNYVSSTFTNFYQRIDQHFSPGFRFGYGLQKVLELETGLIYTTPFKYHHEYRETRKTDINWLNGAYKIDRNFQIPLGLRYRPREFVECRIASDLNFAEQRLDYFTRDTTGVFTHYPTRELSYFNTQPNLNLTYLYDHEKKVNTDEFSQLTKRLLSQGQFIVELGYLRDITSLDKGAGNASQNMIEPYNLFIYPVDLFITGSEYATFFTGNYSRTAANVLLQNYHLFKIMFNYGLTDWLNAGLRFGYRTSSRLHHFTLGNPNQVYDVRERYYQFKPYYFIDFLTDWRLTENSLLTFACHIVPEYRTILKIEGLTKEFHENNKYIDLALRLKILF